MSRPGKPSHVPKAVQLPADPPAAPACGRCKFWVEVGGGYGECRESPPRIPGLVTAHGPALMPGVTRSTDWCGKYQSRQ